MYYVAILDHFSNTIEGLESYSDRNAAIERARSFELDIMCRNDKHPRTCYGGTVSPSVPSTKAWVYPSGDFRVILYGPSETVVVDRTLSSAQEWETFYRSMCLEAQTRGAGYHATTSRISTPQNNFNQWSF